MKSQLLTITVLTLLGSCSTSTLQPFDEDSAKELIINRSDELSKRPEWVNESESYSVRDGNIYSLGMTVIKGDQQIDAAYRIAENNAKSVFSKAIDQRLEYFLQSAREGLEIGADVSRYISTEVSKLNSSGIIVSNKYWEKYIATEPSGQKISRYRVFVRVQIQESILKDQFYKAINKSSGVVQSEEFKKNMDKKWEEMF